MKKYFKSVVGDGFFSDVELRILLVEVEFIVNNCFIIVVLDDFDDCLVFMFNYFLL